MAAKKQSTPEVKLVAPPPVVVKPAGFMSALLTAAQDKYGQTGCFVASDWGKYQWGIPLPNLMMERMFGLNVVPYPAIMEFAGPPHSAKSAMLQYMFDVFLQQGFNAAMLETEGGKVSATLMESILKERLQRLVMYPKCGTQEEWQDKMTMTLKAYRKAYAESVKAKEKNPELRLEEPLLMGLDSLGAAPSMESVKSVDTAGGHSDRSFPVEALKNGRYFSQLPTRMRDLPITLIYTNHETHKIEEGGFGQKGPVEKTSKGGANPDFFASHRFFFAPTTKQEEVVKNTYQQMLKFETYKNSFNRKCGITSVLMQWTEYINPDTGEMSQTTRFLWEDALARFLAPKDGIGYNYDRKEVAKFLTVIRVSDTKFSCKEIGLKEVSGQVIGETIESNPELKAKLRSYMGIKSMNVYNGTPFSTTVQESQPELDAQEEPLPTVEL